MKPRIIVYNDRLINLNHIVRINHMLTDNEITLTNGPDCTIRDNRISFDCWSRLMTGTHSKQLLVRQFITTHNVCLVDVTVRHQRCFLAHHRGPQLDTTPSINNLVTAVREGGDKLRYMYGDGLYLFEVKVEDNSITLGEQLLFVSSNV